MRSMSERTDEVVERLARAGRRRHRALVAGIVRGDELACHGWAADGPPPDGSALFEIGSITKVLTGVLLADMHLRDEVALDDPLPEHLPEPAPDWRERPPTLLELATHRADLPNTPGWLGLRELAYLLGLRRTDPWAGITEERFRELVTAERPRAPGGKIGYSSLGVTLLGEALARRAGLPYEELLRTRVLDPLGMTSTAVTVPDAQAGRLLGGHSRRGRPRAPLEDFLAPAGSLRSSADDMLRFLAACLDPPESPLGEALAFARRPQATMNKRLQIGLCWMLLRGGGGTVVWHNGGTWGFRTFAGFDPTARTAAIVMSNTARSVDALGMELAAPKR